LKTKNKLKLFNDPIYGFITIPNALIFDLIEHKYFQRLRRLSQMGLSYLVYPGAHHTRFHHALGSMFLMQKAIQVLRFKGVIISEDEENALLIAIALHDIGHGPFSHAMEHSIIEGVSHEEISVKIMEILNKEFRGKLSLALEIFKGHYHRNFMFQLISGQLDMDRADYLKRDSFYTGVAEGNINSERLITMLNVVNDELVIEEKGIYSVEKFLTARRLMYWQVYLHKTSLVAEQLLMRVLKRAKELKKRGEHLLASQALLFFLEHKITADTLNFKALEIFMQLDDFDVISALKEWQYSKDFVLGNLCKMILNRNLLRVKVESKKTNLNNVSQRINRLKEEYDISEEEAKYFVFQGEVSNHAYQSDKQEIKILFKTGKVQPISKATDDLNLKILSKSITRYYICYPKDRI
jgi:HD superfamily phosphohydrolase